MVTLISNLRRPSLLCFMHYGHGISHYLTCSSSSLIQLFTFFGFLALKIIHIHCCCDPPSLQRLTRRVIDDEVRGGSSLPHFVPRDGPEPPTLWGSLDPGFAIGPHFYNGPNQNMGSKSPSHPPAPHALGHLDLDSNFVPWPSFICLYQPSNNVRPGQYLQQ